MEQSKLYIKQQEQQRQRYLQEPQPLRQSFPIARRPVFVGGTARIVTEL